MQKQLNLILVQQPGWQAYEDFARLKRIIEDRAPEIEVFIAFNSIASSSVRRKAAKRPTLIVSPGALREFEPERGRVYAGRVIYKPEQIQRMREAGLPVPWSVVLGPDTSLDPSEFGEFVVVKPIATGFLNHGVTRLMRTRAVRYRPPEDFPQEHPGRHAPMLVQSFINTGPQPSHYRVLTLFGEPLYCQWRMLRTAPLDLSADDNTLEAFAVATNAPGWERDRELRDDPDVLSLARDVHSVAPDVPLKGVDIIREHGTGKLFVLEFNPGGNTWHLSSRGGRKGREVVLASTGERGDWRDLAERQFGFFDTAARVLVERTRGEAV